MMSRGPTITVIYKLLLTSAGLFPWLILKQVEKMEKGDSQGK